MMADNDWIAEVEARLAKLRWYQLVPQWAVADIERLLARIAAVEAERDGLWAALVPTREQRVIDIKAIIAAYCEATDGHVCNDDCGCADEFADEYIRRDWREALEPAP